MCYESDIVLETEDARYEVRIDTDPYPERPEWGNVHYYAPNLRRTSWTDEMPPVDTSKAPTYMHDAINRDWYEEPIVYGYARLYRRSDPSGIYLVGQYNEDRYGGDAITILDPGDEEREGGNVLLYLTADEIRRNWGAQRITKMVRQQAIDTMRTEIAAWNAWANGDCYEWELRRYPIGGEGYEEIDRLSGYYGDDEFPYIEELARESAELDVKTRAQARAEAFAPESGMALIAL